MSPLEDSLQATLIAVLTPIVDAAVEKRFDALLAALQQQSAPKQRLGDETAARRVLGGGNPCSRSHLYKHRKEEWIVRLGGRTLYDLDRIEQDLLGK